jgi:imidazolonepropionase-like amidohydrolase
VEQRFEIGVIAPGKLAGIVIWDGDPTSDISPVEDVNCRLSCVC